MHGGKQVIKAGELEEMDTDESGIIEIEEVKENIKGARDVIKIAKRYHGVEFAKQIDSCQLSHLCCIMEKRIGMDRCVYMICWIFQRK